MALGTAYANHCRYDQSAARRNQCRSAGLPQGLQECDYQKALAWLQEKGMAMAANRVDRAASNGMIEIYSHGGGRVGVMVEVNCETDFVARSEQFRTLAHEIALQIAANAPRYVRADDIPADELDTETEKAKLRAKEDGKSGAVVDKIVEGSSRIPKRGRPDCGLHTRL
jgi:translation elongation factor EF-Ts